MQEMRWTIETMINHRSDVLNRISRLLTAETLAAMLAVVRLKIVVLAKMLGGDRVAAEVLIIKGLVRK